MVTFLLPSEIVCLCLFQDIAQSESYWTIALALNISKLFEWCLLLQFSYYFCTSNLQFGFKSGMSTSLCTGTIKNIVARYMHRNTPVFACFLDASKALVPSKTLWLDTCTEIRLCLPASWMPVKRWYHQKHCG